MSTEQAQAPVVAASEVHVPGGGANKQLKENKSGPKVVEEKPAPLNWGWKTDEDLKALYSKAGKDESGALDTAKVAALKAKTNRPAKLARCSKVSFSVKEAAKIRADYAAMVKSRKVVKGLKGCGEWLSIDESAAKLITSKFLQLIQESKAKPFDKECKKAAKQLRKEAKDKYAERSAQIKKELKYLANAKARAAKREELYRKKCKITKSAEFDNFKLMYSVGGCPKYNARSQEFRRFREYNRACQKQRASSLVSTLYIVGQKPEVVA